MKPHSILGIADWAHHSWLARATPARNERARTQAAAYLFTRFPALADPGVAQLPGSAERLARPAYARLMRICASLACAHALRLVVSAEARIRFSATTGLPPLAALQSHPRGDHDDLPLDEPLDFFSRRGLIVAGLALALRAAGCDAQRQRMQLRLPRDCAEAAAQWRLPCVSSRMALELFGDALRLLHARSATC